MRQLFTLGNFLPKRLPPFWTPEQLFRLRHTPIDTEMLPTNIAITEVGGRDGLQNTKFPWAVKERVSLLQVLSSTRLQNIEAGSFVSPKAVPQMAGSDLVYQQISNLNLESNFHVLVPTVKMMEKAIQERVGTISVFISAAEAFSQSNTKKSIAESLVEVEKICQLAWQNGIKVRGYISCIFDSTDRNEKISPYKVLELTQKLLDLGCYEVSLGDTLGTSTPLRTADLLIAFPWEMRRFLAMHFHDTNGRASESFLAAMHYGVRSFDGSIAGLGGCPYAPGAAGNVDTRKLLYLSQVLGIETGVSYNKICKISENVLATIERKKAEQERSNAVSRP